MNAPMELVLDRSMRAEMRRAGAVTDHVMAPACRTGGIVNMPFDAYMTGPELSKSKLWTAHTHSLRHALVARDPSNAMVMGSATHCAVLEPDTFATRYHRGPDDRRGLKWKEAIDEYGDRLLTSADYDKAIAIRDAINSEPDIKRLLSTLDMTEASGFWTDPETGLACRCRPDGYASKMGLLVDLKTTRDARVHGFKRSVAEYGYHAQEAFYTDGWRACGFDVEAFVFIAVETEPPYACCLFELGPQSAEEGRACMRAALAAWAEAEHTGIWPAYPTHVQRLDLPRWAYRLTEAPIGADDFQTDL